jgi:hypothetical protein
MLALSGARNVTLHQRRRHAALNKRGHPFPRTGCGKEAINPFKAVKPAPI